MRDESAYSPESFPAHAIVLWWLPVGAGAPTRLPQITSQWWERMQAWRERRSPHQLVHAALEVFSDGERYVIEMGPEWSNPDPSHAGVIARGPVGFRPLGRSRLFRYEVRCWADGSISDRSWAVGGPVTVSQHEDAARSLLQRIKDVPILTWGRTVRPTGDMWNSNSLVSWLLVTGGIDVSGLEPPNGCRAPGWTAGIVIARKFDSTQ